MSSKKVAAPYRNWKTKEYTPSPAMRLATDRASKDQPPIRSITSKTGLATPPKESSGEER